MPLYMTEFSYSQDSLNALTAHPSDRSQAVAKVLEGYGGKLLHFYWVFGSADVMAIYEMPDSETAMAALMTISSSGAVSSQRTTALLSNADAMKAMTRAGSSMTSYKTPREEWKGWMDDGGES